MGSPESQARKEGDAFQERRTQRQSQFCLRSLLFWICSRPMGIVGETSVTSVI